MLQEECKEKILSEEYRDFMMRDTGALGKNFPLERMPDTVEIRF